MSRPPRLAPALSFALFLLTTLAGTTLAADLTIVRDRDRVTGEFPDLLSEAGFVLDALEGTELTIKVRSADGKAIRPEILLYDPEDVAMAIGAFSSSTKARLRRFVLPVTGRYVLVVRAGADNSGRYRMKLRADHPAKYRDEGEVGAGNVAAHLRFSAFAGSIARFKVRGRDGLKPDVRTLLLPDVSTVSVASVEVDQTTARATGLSIEGLGDFRLVVEGHDGTTGRWKGKVKLGHPEHERRQLVVDGEPAGTFTTGRLERPQHPPPEYPPPQGPVEVRYISWGIYSTVTTQATMTAWTAPDYGKILDRLTLWPFDSFSNPAYTVDFSREIVIAIFLGSRGHRNFSPLIESVERKGIGLHVKWLEGVPGPLCPPPYGDPVEPWILVAVPRPSGPVTFEGRKEVFTCPVPAAK